MRALLVGLLVGFPAIVVAQPAPKTAAEVLKNVQTFYANTKTLEAKFRQVVKNASFGTNESNDGLIFVMKPVKLRAEYLTVNPKTKNVGTKKRFVFDGTTVWYLDDINKTITTSTANQSSLPAAVSFLTGGAALTTNFTVTLVNPTTLELVPKAPSAQIKKMTWTVNPKDWHISNSVVLDPKGDTNEFQFYEPKLDQKLDPTLFTVDPKALPGYKQQGTGAGSAAGSGSSAPATKAPATTPMPKTPGTKVL